MHPDLKLLASCQLLLAVIFPSGVTSCEELTVRRCPLDERFLLIRSSGSFPSFRFGRGVVFIRIPLRVLLAHFPLSAVDEVPLSNPVAAGKCQQAGCGPRHVREELTLVSRHSNVFAHLTDHWHIDSGEYAGDRGSNQQAEQ